MFVVGLGLSLRSVNQNAFNLLNEVKVSIQLGKLSGYRVTDSANFRTLSRH